MTRRRITDLLKFWERRNRVELSREATNRFLIQVAENGNMKEADIAKMAAIFPLWEENTPHTKGCLRRCPQDEAVYRCIDPPPVSPQARNSRIPPSQAERFWERVGDAEMPAEGSDAI